MKVYAINPFSYLCSTRGQWHSKRKNMIGGSTPVVSPHPNPLPAGEGLRNFPLRPLRKPPRPLRLRFCDQQDNLCPHCSIATSIETRVRSKDAFFLFRIGDIRLLYA